MKNICLIGAGSGGSELLNVLKTSLKKEYVNNYIVKTIATTKYAKQKMNDYKFLKEDKLYKFLNDNKFDLIINERSNDLLLQNNITNFCNLHNFLNISILDMYGSYKNRFTSLPNYIFVPSLKIKNELLEEVNISEKKVIITGNPAFEKIKSIKYIKQNNKKILFISQPLLEARIGNQYKVFNEFYNEINKYNNSYNFEIKLHPRENNKNWKKYIKNWKNCKLVKFNDKKDFLKNCINYELVISDFSTILLQCYYANIPQIAYINYKEQITNYFNNTFLNITYYDDFVLNSTKITIEHINKILNKKQP